LPKEFDSERAPKRERVLPVQGGTGIFAPLAYQNVTVHGLAAQK